MSKQEFQDIIHTSLKLWWLPILLTLIILPSLTLLSLNKTATYTVSIGLYVNTNRISLPTYISILKLQKLTVASSPGSVVTVSFTSNSEETARLVLEAGIRNAHNAAQGLLITPLPSNATPIPLTQILTAPQVSIRTPGSLTKLLGPGIILIILLYGLTVLLYRYWKVDSEEK